MGRKLYAKHDDRLGSYYGTMGERIPNHLLPKGYFAWLDGDLHVGDMVSVVKGNDDLVTTGLLVKSNDGNFYVMGYWNTSLHRFAQIRKVLPHELVTNEIAHKLHKFQIVEPKRMTMQEVERELGYPFIIVRGDE